MYNEPLLGDAPRRRDSLRVSRLHVSDPRQLPIISRNAPAAVAHPRAAHPRPARRSRDGRGGGVHAVAAAADDGRESVLPARADLARRPGLPFEPITFRVRDERTAEPLA